ncbi:aldo/keto reductase [Armatimonas sp.]|uniref:aldo/keto reductase n=1 Tax=Armatimonas sp. TaxID=1872638 RepID=UPI00286D3B22|nr:aldo/keto reductase [Armatimonas sp.]
MQYNALGKTGLSISALGFGAAPLGGSYGLVTQANATQAVRVALELGINFFDTSPWYQASEDVLGEALVGVARESYVLCTKLGRYPDAQKPAGHFDFSAARVRQSIDNSLRRLKTDQLDIALCHDIEFAEDFSQVLEETLPTLRECVAAGKVRFVGVSGLPLAIYPKVLESTSLDVILSYCHSSLNDNSLWDLIPYLNEKSVGVIGASPLAMGLLSDTGPQPWHPAPEALRLACLEALAWCKANGFSLAELAVAWTLQNAPVATTLVGMSSEAQVRQNTTVVGTLPDPQAIEAIQAILAPVQRLTWPSGTFH